MELAIALALIVLALTAGVGIGIKITQSKEQFADKPNPIFKVGDKVAVDQCMWHIREVLDYKPAGRKRSWLYGVEDSFGNTGTIPEIRLSMWKRD